jgi:hypothetical protein
MFRKLLFLAIPIGAIFGPIAYFSGSDWVSQVTASLSGGAADGNQGGGGGEISIDGLVDMPLEGAEVEQFWEVIRFDATPDWITQRWPRVTASTHELNLQGFRVPLVTGTDQTDLAGSLTYYFNHQRYVEKITFMGTTGDYRRLLGMLTTHYGFVSRPTNTPGVILFEVPSSESYLWVRPADVLRADQPLKQFEVSLVLQRPR